MTQFSRSQRWLPNIFPESKAPRTGWPSRVSDDISLVHQWLSGYEVDPTSIYNTLTTIIPGAVGTGTILSIGTESIGKILTLHTFLAAAAVPTSCEFRLVDPGGNITLVTENLTPVLSAGRGVGRGTVLSTIIPPGFSLTGAWAGGNGTTQINFTAGVVVNDLGVIFGN